jgi:phosphoglycerate kinase
VNDAFGSAHRAHASTAGITKFVSKSAAGLLMQKELEYLGKATTNPEKPFVAIIGGAKVSDKIDVIRNLLGKVDALLIGGAMAYTFLKAQGKKVGKSLVEEDKLGLAKELIAEAQSRKVRLLLPLDHVIADKIDASAPTQTVTTDAGIPDGQMGLDIGPETIAAFGKEIAAARTILWNGPMGVFEVAPFARGTMKIAQMIAANQKTISIVGGGDSVAAVHQSGVANKISHISTGGGASLEFLEGKKLPGVEALTDV